VHEGPSASPNRRRSGGHGQALLPGMFLSNEPGYYKTGAYGIRIENLVLVEARQSPGAEGSIWASKR
jgi:Xaa-Pro aminopeptidase